MNIYSILTVISLISCVSSEWSDFDFNKYHHYKDLETLIKSYTTRFPHLAKYGSIGKSVEGRELYYIQISNNVEKTEPGEPMFKYLGNMHGNEAVGRQLIIYLIQYLLENYDQMERVKNLVDSTNIYLVPSINPDGFEHASNNVTSSEYGEDSCTGVVGRENARHMDLNRNFPDQFRSTGPEIQPETRAVMEWIENNYFVLSCNLHGGSVVASYPYDSTITHQQEGVYSKCPDDQIFRHLALMYASNHKTMPAGNLCEGDHFPQGVTNGAHWYNVPGGMQDYNYLHSNCFEITVELSCCKYPHTSRLSIEWNNNKESLIKYIEQVHIGVTGFVTDDSGQAIEHVNITVSGINHTIVSATYGDYWRLLTPGKYDLTFEKDGYSSRVVRDIEVTDGPATPLNVTLTKITNLPIADMLAVVDLFKNSSTIQNLGGIIEPTTFKHHSNADLVLFLTQTAAKYPTITKLNSIGESVERRGLLVLEISDNVGIHEEGEPEFKYIANMHGNEVVGRETLIPLIQVLCENYGKNAFITSLVDNTRIFIMPTMNPDGHEIAHEGDGQGYVGRPNGAHVDLNRNFPDMYAARTSPIQPETQAVMAWSKKHPFVLSANLHGGSMVANYPYDAVHDPARKMSSDIYSRSPDDTTFKHLALAFSWAHKTMHLGHPCGDKFAGGIVNGAHWYQLTGGMQDWNYLYTNDLELTIEQGCVKYPLAKDLKDYWDANKFAYLTYIAEVHRGMKGFVLDDDTGSGISGAVISVAGINHTVSSNIDHGDYWRIISPGTYQVTASAESYLRQTKTVVVTTGEATRVDFRLHKAIPDNWSHDNDFDIADNLKSEDISVESIEDIFKMLEKDNIYTKRIQISPLLDSIEGLKISGNLDADDSRPKILLLGGLHKQESIGRNVLIRLARHLVTGYNQNPNIKQLIDNSHVYIIPQVSTPEPEAPAASCQTPEADSDQITGSRLEMIMNLISEEGFHLGLSIESGGQLVRIPWDMKKKTSDGNFQTSPDAASTFTMLAQAYVSGNPALSESGGHDCSGQRFENGFIEGSKWYSPKHEILDRAFVQNKTFMISAHVSCCPTVTTEQYPIIYSKNLQSIMNFLHKSQQGIRGEVYDESGDIVANTFVQIDHEDEKYSIDERGVFYRIATPGVHLVQASAPGHETDSQQIAVHEDQTSIDNKLELRLNKNHINYHHKDAIDANMTYYSAQYEHLTKLYSIGESQHGTMINVIKLTCDDSKSHYKPRVAVVGGLTGSDVISTEISLQLINNLLGRYKDDFLTKKILDETEVHVLPLANPDNYNIKTDTHCADPNDDPTHPNLDKNFPTASSTGIESHTETKLISSWLSDKKFHLVIHLKAGGNIVTYPYNKPIDTEASVENVPCLNETLKAFADGYTHEENFKTYLTQLSGDNIEQCHVHAAHVISGINGALVDPHGGSLIDYAYETGALGISVYLGCCTQPSGVELARIWNSHRDSLLHSMAQVHEGVEISLTNPDAVKSAAFITVNGCQLLPRLDPNTVLYQPLTAGVYHIEIDAPGFEKMSKKVTLEQMKHMQISFAVKDSSILGMGKKTFIAGIVAAIILLILSIILVLVCCCRDKASSFIKGNGFHSLKNYDDEGSYAFNSRTALLSQYKDDDTDSDFDVYKQPTAGR